MFFLRRTPNAVALAAIFLFASLINPVLYLPYVVGDSQDGRKKRRIGAGLFLAISVAAMGYFAWSDAADEDLRDVSKNLTARITVNQRKPFISAFSIINTSGFPILSRSMYCVVNEAFLTHDGIIGETTTGAFKPPIVVKSQDAESTQCLTLLNTGDELECADVALKVDYQLQEFPHRRELKEYRFLLRLSGPQQLEWFPMTLGLDQGLCGGSKMKSP